jgi:hypothetical protein
MNGWSIIFAVTSAGSAVWGSAVNSVAALYAAVLFAVLFLLALCTRAIRGIVC